MMAAESRLEHDHTDAQRKWNYGKRAAMQNTETIQKLSAKIDELRSEGEVSTNIAFDTSDMETDVSEAEQCVEILGEKKQELLDAIKEDEPEVATTKSD